MPFVDIAGRSNDTVFIATHSANVIEYKKGSIKVIGAANGSPTTVNSVGMVKVEAYYTAPHTLLIGSDKGIYTYDLVEEKITANSLVSASQVYEASGHDLVYKDSAGINKASLCFH